MSTIHLDNNTPRDISNLVSPNSINFNTPTSYDVNNVTSSNTPSNINNNTASTSATISLEPQRLVDWNKIIQLFNQLIDDNNINTILLHHVDGTLLCMSGKQTITIQKLIASLTNTVFNIYKNYSITNNSTNNSTSALQTITIHNESYKYYIQPITEYFILTVVSGNNNSNIGLVKHNISLLVDKLKPLQKVYEPVQK